MRVILSSAAILGFAIAPAAACSWGKAEMTMAERGATKRTRQRPPPD